MTEHVYVATHKWGSSILHLSVHETEEAALDTLEEESEYDLDDAFEIGINGNQHELSRERYIFARENYENEVLTVRKRKLQEDEQ